VYTCTSYIGRACCLVVLVCLRIPDCPEDGSSVILRNVLMYTASYTGRLECSMYDLCYFSPFSCYLFCHLGPAVLSTLLSSPQNLVFLLGWDMKFHALQNRTKNNRFHPKMIMFVSVRFSNKISSSSLAYGPYSLTSTSFRMIAHTDLSSALFLHLLTSIDFRSFSVV
jgi:hypothetical protein